MTQVLWTADWSAFIESVCHGWNAGLSDHEVTRKHAGQRAKWTGTVIDQKHFLDARSVAVQMPDVNFKLRNGKNGQANYVALNVAPEHAVEWQNIMTGDRIKFETEIEMASSEDPFTTSGIEWSDLGDNTGYIKIKTRNSRLIEVLENVS